MFQSTSPTSTSCTSSSPSSSSFNTSLSPATNDINDKWVTVKTKQTLKNEHKNHKKAAATQAATKAKVAATKEKVAARQAQAATDKECAEAMRIMVEQQEFRVFYGTTSW